MQWHVLINTFFFVLVVLDFCLLRYFPSRNLVDPADNCYTSLYFLFLLFFYVYSIQNFKICCYLFLLFSPVFYSALCPFHPILFDCSFYSLFCFLPLFIHFFYSDLPYCFLFKSVIPSFLFSFYSVLSASPLCSITIQSVLFLLVFIFLDPSI